MNLVGNYLNQEEIKKVISGFKDKQKFQNLLNEMKQFEAFTFDENLVEVTFALQFDVKYDGVFSAKAINLKLNDKVALQYITRHENADTSTENDFFWGTIQNHDEPGVIKIMNFKAQTDTYVSSFESELKSEAVVEAAKVDEETEEAFPITENYYPGMLLEQEVETAWYNGCLPGGYVWCGKECGGSIACNSSTYGVNELDNCCKTHDCCYKTRGVSYKNCYCDSRLCSCSQAAPFAWNKAIVQTAMCSSC